MFLYTCILLGIQSHYLHGFCVCKGPGYRDFTWQSNSLEIKWPLFCSTPGRIDPIKLRREAFPFGFYLVSDEGDQ